MVKDGYLRKEGAERSTIYLNENNGKYKKETALLAEEFFRQRLEGLPNETGNKVTQTFPYRLGA